MIINLGYVAISMKLKDLSPNKTITLKNLVKIDREHWEVKVESLAKQNIANTIKILRYNNAYGIKLYRFTSKLIPLVTHPEFSAWNWKEIFKSEFQELGSVVKETNSRVSTHPDHFTLINSPRKDVMDASIKDLDYHCSMFELMNLGYEYKMVIHVGGMYKNKEYSIKRFYDGFFQLEDRIKKRLILENDDKIYNVEDVLTICNNLKIPMVVDIHHDMCNPSKYKLIDIIDDIFSTWKDEKFHPKIHFSSPKCEKEIRSHHEYINSQEFINFLNGIRGKVGNFDVMLEAKNKDLAVFKLMEDLSGYDHIKKVGDATIEVN
ncbi:UV DNA damage repair endonuclease UvsE [Fonticella tunisiensis]|uniref:UV-damage endonuclease n=1 Tax=Fonticella tunisiensis TaxID=1096341 RepID=A0A4V3EUL1_9CLOT|nr:UV DNA damage repair endonuclease UvsE [Fonticella tunisiensis]TDT63595.1 UV-damage endonuclease [Fonticella tunisiensis]